MKLQNLLLGCAAACALGTVSNAAPQHPIFGPNDPFRHIVIIYEENHSFDNLYGLWDNVNGDQVDGLKYAKPAKTVQVQQDNTTPYQCLLQDDVNLTSPPLPSTCTDSANGMTFNSDFVNAPFEIDNYIAPTDTTCPLPSQFAPNGVPEGQGQPGGCTRDLVHRYYQEQYQLNGGKQNRYVTGSDAVGLSMGYYNTKQLPIYAYLHTAGAPHYVIADRFFQGAFGGSFLNHQFLVAAAAPVFSGAPNDAGAQDLHSVVDQNGMPTSYPLYSSPLGGQAKDAQLTASCNPPAGRPATPAGVTCGDYAVNTIQPWFLPYAPGTADYKRLPPITNPNIGDRLSEAGVKWAWYSGGWSNAAGEVGAPGWTNGGSKKKGCTDPNHNPASSWPYCPDYLFQYHHQALNYFANYAPGTKARKEHLRDEAEFIQRANKGELPTVSFVKPIGEENEHPGYTGENGGDSHLVDLLNAISNGPEGKDTLVIVTYDEFGGQWDHVSPPGMHDPHGVHDKWGPGTRIPAILISPAFKYSRVDHSSHDTTSIIATLEHRFDLAPVGGRDRRVLDLTSAINLGLYNGR
ncbi:MAG TPA: alkaline phosphatase family protein [Rhizomicrobium sp.]